MILPGTGMAAQAFRLGLAIAAAVSSLLPLLRLFNVKEGKNILHLIGTMTGRIR
jgi:hypothetical protein